MGEFWKIKASEVFSIINSALADASMQFIELTGEPFPVTPKLEVIENDGFWALAELEDGIFRLRISSAISKTVGELWGQSLNDPHFVNQTNRQINATAEELTHLSLVWLLLHEMQHYSLGHFELTGRHYLAETDRAHDFALVSRAPARSSIFDTIPVDSHSKVVPYLELQADHDAIELVLDAYSPEEWPSLRHRTLAISAVMMLIERTDAKRGAKPSSHPKAATRIFQLLGHLMDMPFIQSQLASNDLELPPDDEIAAFNEEVVLPAFQDAVALARIAEAPSIADDLGDGRAFFTDIGIAKLGDASEFEKLQTVGARQWADLVLLNSQLLKLQGHS